MFAFLKSLIGDSPDGKVSSTAAKDAKTREAEAKAAKLAELRSRLDLIFKKDPLQVLGLAFVVEVDPDTPETVAREEWQQVMSKAKAALSTVVGKDGFVRRVSAVDYFVRFGRVFDPAGNLSCEPLFTSLQDNIDALGCGHWNVRFRAALPWKDEIHFVPVTDAAPLRTVLEPYMVESRRELEGPVSPDAIVLVDGLTDDDRATPVSAANAEINQTAQSSPAWRPDNVWERVSNIPEWREALVHGKKLRATRVYEDNGQGTGDATRPPPSAVAVTSWSAADRIAKTEDRIAEQIDRVAIRYQPMWDMGSKRITAAFAVPTLVQDGLVVRTGDDLFGRGIGAKVSGKLSRHMLARAWADMELVDGTETVTLAVPFHYGSFQNSVVREALVGDLRRIAEKRPPNRRLISVIVNTPKDAPGARLGEFAQMMRTFVDSVWIEYIGPEAEIGSINRASIAQIGFEVGKNFSEDALIGSVLGFVDKAKGKGFLTFARGAFTANLAQGLPAMGIDQIAGSERLTDLTVASSADRSFDIGAVVAGCN